MGLDYASYLPRVEKVHGHLLLLKSQFGLRRLIAGRLDHEDNRTGRYSSTHGQGTGDKVNASEEGRGLRGPRSETKVSDMGYLAAPKSVLLGDHAGRCGEPQIRHTPCCIQPEGVGSRRNRERGPSSPPHLLTFSWQGV